MGTCSFSIKVHSLSTLLIFLIILSSTHARFLPQGGSSFKPIDKNLQMERRNLLIGSRPPRCEKRYCINCGHCEAVQVPIVPKVINTTQQASSTTTKHILNSRGDDLSNYKPMCWKCKCGDFMFNP
ncbi:putative EPIDERMAL PATTERNING FACTOR-like protein [Helianthus annuus]|uniref:Epidermal patterning factor-like protein n=1 Tax=Helianthus annuus TaxID=4232 RepID=A0A251SA78_HELAN|nr:EPIDERMAL PATTERNING FACTOR-like protein 2 [Helianthus annuus]XP_022012470.1 EPIDERMAL PATTERNING FACTOR-like protein 2 [Helianthus annuus]KAF5765689.1 putative EPIDERMAL PATTERNING FACTOR-like protein [Helianthus annuus]KAJ0452172.1 putative EPIDERMAL PATTERNING FACTOR-like protein [Helianthus annuus]KAJ0456977.1 putative EPIDERMAL PATTERNING FACTOR-like protein [Helianthus annuus]KAJ0474079.1 putative EPIDERMAL PATTERNING FACTOR-like protein [Helianthus annuus]KAJ0649641.1 putative EPIDE